MFNSYEYEMLFIRYLLRPVTIVDDTEYLSFVDPTNTIIFSLSIQEGGFKVYVREDGIYEIMRSSDLSTYKSKLVGFIKTNVIILGHDSSYKIVDKIMTELNKYELGTPRFIIQTDMKIFIKMNFLSNKKLK